MNCSLIFRQGAFIGIALQMGDLTDQRGRLILSISTVLADRIMKVNVIKRSQRVHFVSGINRAVCDSPPAASRKRERHGVLGRSERFTALNGPHHA
jgi:hypothetical protein